MMKMNKKFKQNYIEYIRRDEDINDISDLIKELSSNILNLENSANFLNLSFGCDPKRININDFKKIIEDDSKNILYINIDGDNIIIHYNEDSEFFKINSKNKLEKYIKKIEDINPNFLLSNYELSNSSYWNSEMTIVNLENKSYEFLKSRANLKLITNFINDSFVIQLYNAGFTLSKNRIEYLFEQYPELKIEYLRKCKAELQVIREAERRVLSSSVYELNDEDKLLIEVIDDL